ncbi:MAG: UDP-N-acetylmuramoyl-L-alanine--D-glutamate ligase [Candidatus Doudnabacteria bacterium]|nr:UDP-N-acetylmuramoyl-L-alanine--D-glutamate ligase [Candidatus Doudnabacteria bacterium]
MLEQLRNKKIAIVGLGKNNQKLAEFLSGKNIKYEIVDGWKSPNELVGKLDSFDIIFRSPGLPYLSAAVQQAKRAGVQILSQTKLFFQLCPAPIVGVTGTKGKGTTSSLIAKILETAGRRTWLAGNIGRDPFEFVEKLSASDIVVLELSSFQLQDLGQSPHIAVVLSITPDHLNHHHDFEEYIHAKAQILSHQKPTDFAVLHPNLPDWFKNQGQAEKIVIEPGKVAQLKRKLLGEHNLDNIAAAKAVAEILKIDPKVVEKVVAEFEPLPHRLSVLKTVKGITYIDDGFSTNIEPTIAAINAVTTPVILIIGGSEKGLDFTALGKKIVSADKVKGLVVIGEVTGKILKVVEGFKGKVLTGAENMTKILEQAQSLAAAGDTILFSPATASFGLFKDEFDRAEQFVNAADKL